MTLTIQDLGALGELLGSIAVLATLIYLALQTRQNTMAIGAQLDSARLANLVNLNVTWATSTTLLPAFLEDPTPEGMLRRIGWWMSWLNTYQWQFIQARRGLLPTYNDRGTISTLRGFFEGSHGFADFWDSAGKSSFLPDFVEWVEEQRAKAA